jgi:uncharacterized protein YkwD
MIKPTLLALLAALLLAPTARAASVPDQGTVLKLLNQARSANGVGPVRLDPQLNRAALGHSQDMVGEHYFDHTAPSGEDLRARVKATGYGRGGGGWVVGENIGEAAGAGATADMIVAAWLASPGHRANLLDPHFRVVGIGIADGASTDAEGLTITTDFGTAVAGAGRHHPAPARTAQTVARASSSR